MHVYTNTSGQYKSHDQIEDLQSDWILDCRLSKNKKKTLEVCQTLSPSWGWGLGTRLREQTYKPIT